MRRQAYDVLSIGGTVRDILCLLRAGGEGGVSLDRGKKHLSLALDAKHPAKTMPMTLGGGAANAAVACARLGLHVGLVSAVGRDAIGEELLHELKKEHVDTSLVAHVSLEQTAVSIVLTEELSGEQTSLYVGGASRLLEITEDVQKAFHTTQWVVLASLGDAWDDNEQFLLDALEGEPTQLALALGPGGVRLGAEKLSRLLARSSVLLLTDKEAAAFVGGTHGAVEDELLATGPEIVVLTSGEQGALIRTAGERFHVPPVRTTVADTLGAGDAFGATFVGGLVLFQGDIARAAQYAALNAASVVSFPTAQKGLLNRVGLDERYRRAAPQVHREVIGEKTQGGEKRGFPHT